MYLQEPEAGWRGCMQARKPAACWVNSIYASSRHFLPPYILESNVRAIQIGIGIACEIPIALLPLRLFLSRTINSSVVLTLLFWWYYFFPIHAASAHYEGQNDLPQKFYQNREVRRSNTRLIWILRGCICACEHGALARKAITKLLCIQFAYLLVLRLPFAAKQ